jgi:hypothetical protein
MLVIAGGILLAAYVILSLALGCSQIKPSGTAGAPALPYRPLARKF